MICLGLNSFDLLWKEHFAKAYSLTEDCSFIFSTQERPSSHPTLGNCQDSRYVEEVLWKYNKLTFKTSLFIHAVSEWKTVWLDWCYIGSVFNLFIRELTGWLQYDCPTPLWLFLSYRWTFPVCPTCSSDSDLKCFRFNAKKCFVGGHWPTAASLTDGSALYLENVFMGLVYHYTSLGLSGCRCVFV